MMKNKIIIIFIILLIALLSVFALYYFGVIGSRIYLSENMKLQKMIGEYDELENMQFTSAEVYRIKIDGFIKSDEYKLLSVYAFTVTDSYTKTDSTGKSGALEYPGTPQKQYDNLPRLYKGEELVIITNCEAAKINIQGVYIYAVQEIDGAEYLYPLNYSTSALSDGSLPFKYKSEAYIHKRNSDYDIIKYLEKRSRARPEFSGKYTLAYLLDNYTRLYYSK